MELKGNKAVVCSLGKSSQLYDVPDCRTQQLSLLDATDRHISIDFQLAVKQLIGDYKVDKVIVRERLLEGLQKLQAFFISTT